MKKIRVFDRYYESTLEAIMDQKLKFIAVILIRLPITIPFFLMESVYFVLRFIYESLDDYLPERLDSCKYREVDVPDDYECEDDQSNEYR